MPDQTLEDRFWEKVDRRGPDECWEWKASRDPKGYGFFWNGTKMVRASRAAYEFAIGPLPAKRPGTMGAVGVVVRHSCDNPPCCNPAHLRAGSQLENMADRRERGRAPDYNGARNPKAKLTPSDVRAIRASATGRYGERMAIAREYGISSGHVSKILDGAVWADV